MNTNPVCYPTIDPDTDLLLSHSGISFPAPITGRDLVAQENSLYIAKDEDGNDVLCENTPEGTPLPTLEGVNFVSQVAEFFIGPRPNRRRPRPTLS